MVLALRGEDALGSDGVTDEVSLALAAGSHEDGQTTEGVNSTGEATSRAGGRSFGKVLSSRVARGTDLLLLLGGDDGHVNWVRLNFKTVLEKTKPISNLK